MTLDELEAQTKSEDSQDPDDPDEDLVCEWIADEKAKAKQNKKVMACTDKIFSVLFGKNHQNLSGKERVAKVLSKAFDLEAAQEIEDDLMDSLNMLDDCLILMEQLLSQHPQLMGIDLVNQMEEISEHIAQWGMGEHNDEDKKLTTIKLD